MSSPSSSDASASSPSTRKTSISSIEPSPVCSNLSNSHENDAFNRWRPTYHIQAPSGWMNDPCAPGYDATTGLYHVSFQWNPNGPDWGDISWGTAYSRDMIHWNIRERPSLSPDQHYDREGVFTGCHIPTTDGSLLYAYTSVNSLPIHHTLPHLHGSESLSLAKSTDGGLSWTKSSSNPILQGEPDGIDVTGWRDPFIGKWSSMASFLNLDPGTLFGVISGGIRDITPTTFLYSIDPNSPEHWNYIGPLIDIGLDLDISLDQITSKWSVPWGLNWEVTNFATLHSDDGKSIDILIPGAEHTSSSSPSKTPARPPRSQLWISGELQKPPNPKSYSGPVEMIPTLKGYIDYGSLYAAQTFRHPISGNLILWGWIPEDDLCDELRHQQGWSGSLSMPREIFIQTVRHVQCASASDLRDIASIDCEPDSSGCYTIRTLASRPLQHLTETLRSCRQVSKTHFEDLKLDERIPIASGVSTVWELDVELEISTASEVGLSMVFSDDEYQRLELAYSPLTEILTLSRPALSTPDSPQLVNSAPENAPHTLFTIRNPIDGTLKQEQLRIRMWRDKSALEIFVNERTVITTRIYGGETEASLCVFSRGGESTLTYGTLWDGIGLTSVGSL